MIGAYITLLHAIRTQAPLFRLTPTFPCSYHAPILITGAAFDSEADLRFSLWQVRFPELNAWAGKHGFEAEAGEVFTGGDRPAVRIDYRTPERKVLLSGAGGLELTLSFWPLLRMRSIPVRLGAALSSAASTHAPRCRAFPMHASASATNLSWCLMHWIGAATIGNTGCLAVIVYKKQFPNPRGRPPTAP